jgi:hypothetical protein
MLTVAGCVTVRTAEPRGGDTIAGSSVMPVPSARLGKGPGAVLVVAEIKEVEKLDPGFECRWRVINQETSKSYFITLNASSPQVFTQLDPGTYKTGRLGCGVSRVWDINDVFKDGFHVEHGAVSYLGKLFFEFKNGELETVRKATRVESARAFASAMNETPASVMPAISGFTGRKVEPAMVDSGEALRNGFDVYAKGFDDAGRQLESLVTHLKSCEQEESVRDHLRFGRLEYIALYKLGRFNEMKSRRETNAFSDKLRSCVERGMMAFHPTGKDDLEVRVRY